ncbi:hypothetical protein ACFR9U_04035 [Halorientalis brevis]|uniref:Small CPxCG-related zinc finger protein n=1 Tax=Halorientalis brevis TaxID=1126241 RepID=A0ABD6C7E8_9EURY|nr:hypothetical protein [Halorientalis brevis]
MAKESCDGCGRTVTIAGGISDFWSLSRDKTEGLLLELADGSEWFLCNDCIEQLPDDRDVTAADVRELPGDG